MQRQDKPEDPTTTLKSQISHGEFRPALEYLNGRSMADMLERLGALGFADLSYLLANLGAAAGLGPASTARLETAIRAIGLRSTGTSGELLTPMLDAMGRSGVRKISDQLEALRRHVPVPPGGWETAVQAQLGMTRYGPFLDLPAADAAFRILDFAPDQQLSLVLRQLEQAQLRFLITNNRAADRYDGERIKQSLDSTWRQRFPMAEAPWPKATATAGLDVAGMSAMDKLAEAIRRAEKFGGEELQGKLAELLTPSSLAFMAATMIIFAVLEGSTAGAAGVALVALSALLIGPAVLQVANDINGFLSTALGARDETDLDRAGQFFARAAISISVDILIAVLLHKPTKAATPKIQAGAKSAVDFLKGPKDPPAGGLTPALAVAGDGTPRFVQAPAERFKPSPAAETTHQTTGSGVYTATAEAARPSLAAMGMDAARQDALLAGASVMYETANGVICIAQIVQGRLRVGIFSINIKNDPAAAVRGFASFRGPARAAARALQVPEYEMFGAAIVNSEIEAMLLRQGFAKSTETVPEAFGLGPSTQVEILTKRFPVR
ncbi:hypothetical protein [Actinoplanes sp. NPDC089786]|uniref:hypothetical protein n=1 Tax=Actinoplanes sp. NPDC089786 TaxID=3155185 RepID=UPI00341C105B